MIDWSKNAREIHNQVRSMLDFPTAYTFFNGKMLKIIETEVKKNDKNANFPEIISVSKQGIEVITNKDILLIKKVKPESKGIMDAYDFANGAKLKTGMKFGE